MAVGAALVAAAVPAAAGTTGTTAAGSTLRVSPQAAGPAGAYSSGPSSTSGDGRYVAFTSRLALDARDKNGRDDVYVWDRTTRTTRRASAPLPGKVTNGHAWLPRISRDGRYVAFVSDGGNLAPAAPGGVDHVYVRDLVAGTTRLVDVTPGGAPGNGVAGPQPLAMTPDGRTVAFGSSASDLVAGDTNGVADVFVRDLVAGTTRRVSVSSTGVQGDDSSFGPAISADGTVVAFSSGARNLVAGGAVTAQVYVRDLVAGTTVLESRSDSGAAGDDVSNYPSISDDGRVIAFQTRATNLVPGDTNGQDDVVLRDLRTRTTTLVSTSSSEQPARGASDEASISADGSRVAFWTTAGLVAGDTNGASDVYVRDVAAGTTVRASVPAAGASGSGGSDPSLSADGRSVSFATFSALVPGDTNGTYDIYERRLGG